MKLHNEHRMLCERHFNDADFTDESKGKLIRTAVPYDTAYELPTYSAEPQAGPSQRVSFRDLTNVQNVPSVENTEAIVGTPFQKEKPEKAKMLYVNCRKY